MKIKEFCENIENSDVRRGYISVSLECLYTQELEDISVLVCRLLLR